MGYMYSLCNVEKRLDQVASATDVLHCRIDLQFVALSEIVTILCDSNKTMSVSFEPFLQRHHKELQHIASKLAQTNTNVSEKLEPALESTCEEISNLRILQRETLSAAKVLQGGINQLNASVGQELFSLNAQHQETKLRLDNMDEQMQNACRVADQMRDTLNSELFSLTAQHQKTKLRLDSMDEHMQNACSLADQMRDTLNSELFSCTAQHQETKFRLNTVDEQMQNARSVADEMRGTMNSLNLRVERVEPEQEKQREDVLQINKVLEAARHQITASQRLGEENHRKFRAMAEARKRIDCKDQESFDSLNSSVGHLSVLLKEMVHRVNSHEQNLKMLSTPIRPATAPPCSKRLDGALPYCSVSQTSRRREDSASSRHSDDMTWSPFKDARPSSTPASARFQKEHRLLKQAIWDVPTNKEARHLSEQPLLKRQPEV